MADKKITELTAYTPPIDTDVLPIVDVTTPATKKITWANIKAALKTYLDAIYAIINGFPSDENLVGYWAFDEGTGAVAYDNSGNGRNCALQATPSWITGVAGKALTFASASSQYGIIPALGNQFGAGTMTICFRLKTDTSSSARQRLVTSADYMTAFFGDTGNSGSDLRVYLYNGGWSGGDLFANCILRDDAWHFYVININGATVSIYRDGVLIDTKNTGKTLLANMTNVLYPVCGTTPSEYVNGSFDELRIYSTILTAAQVYALYKYPRGNGSIVKPALSGSGAPTGIVPFFIGQTYVDTSGAKIYISAGISADTDWKILN